MGCEASSQRSPLAEMNPVLLESCDKHWDKCGSEEIQAGNYGHAIVCFDSAIGMNPNEASYFDHRGNAKILAGLYADAIIDFGKAIDLSPNYPLNWSNRGSAKILSGDQYAGAITDFDEAIRLAPDSAIDWDKVGKTGYLSDSHAAPDTKLKLYQAFCFNYRGIAKFSMGKVVEAIIDYDEAIKLNPHEASYHSKRGSAKIQNDDAASALIDFDNAIRLNPHEAIYWTQRGDIKKNRGDITGAEADYKEARRLEFKNKPELILYVAYQANNQQAAREALEQITSKSAKQPEVYNPETGHFESALLALARFGHVHFLEPLYDCVDLGTTDVTGNTALHFAAEAGHIGFIDALIAKGALPQDPQHRYEWPINKKGLSPLHMTMMHGRIACLIHLKKKYNADILTPAQDGNTLFHLLVLNDKADSINELSS